MTEQTTEKLQNMNIQQEFDGSEFDPYSPQENIMNNQAELTNGHGRHVNFDGDSLNDVGDTQEQKVRQAALQRNMSEGEVLGYQTEYGESIITGQMEYGVDSDEEGSAQNTKRNYGHVENDYLMSTGQPLVEFDNEVEGTNNYSNQDIQDNEYGNAEATGGYDDGYTDEGGYVDEMENVPSAWQQENDQGRSRRSVSPARSMSPPHQDMSGVGSSQFDSSPSDVALPQLPGHSDDSQSIPYPDNVSVSDCQSVMSFSESDILSPRLRKKGIPKPKSRRGLELPPWDDNVVIPPPPRMKPTLIGKQADLPPPPPSPHRPKSAHSRRTDGSSDSGVEEDRTSGLRSPKKTSADVKKKYGTDSQNRRYKPGGGNVQVVSQRLDLKSVGPRTDSTAPRSAVSARDSPAPSERSITSPKPSPNTANARSKIGSLNNVRHSPGGGNIQVLNAKVDYSSVKSKVGSKDKIDHKPKGGDKKIESRKLDWKTESRVGSLKNSTHTPGGGNVKIDGCSIEEDLGLDMYCHCNKWKTQPINTVEATDSISHDNYQTPSTQEVDVTIETIPFHEASVADGNVDSHKLDFSTYDYHSSGTLPVASSRSRIGIWKYAEVFEIESDDDDEDEDEDLEYAGRNDGSIEAHAEANTEAEVRVEIADNYCRLKEFDHYEGKTDEHVENSDVKEDIADVPVEDLSTAAVIDGYLALEADRIRREQNSCRYNITVKDSTEGPECVERFTGNNELFVDRKENKISPEKDCFKVNPNEEAKYGVSEKIENLKALEKRFKDSRKKYQYSERGGQSTKKSVQESTGEKSKTDMNSESFENTKNAHRNKTSAYQTKTVSNGHLQDEDTKSMKNDSNRKDTTKKDKLVKKVPTISETFERLAGFGYISSEDSEKGRDMSGPGCKLTNKFLASSSIRQSHPESCDSDAHVGTRDNENANYPQNRTPEMVKKFDIEAIATLDNVIDTFDQKSQEEVRFERTTSYSEYHPDLNEFRSDSESSSGSDDAFVNFSDDSEDERKISYAELKVKPKMNTHKVYTNGIQTTTYKYKVDNEPANRLPEIRQTLLEMKGDDNEVECLKRRLSTEDQRDSLSVKYVNDDEKGRKYVDGIHKSMDTEKDFSANPVKCFKDVNKEEKIVKRRHTFKELGEDFAAKPFNYVKSNDTEDKDMYGRVNCKYSRKDLTSDQRKLDFFGYAIVHEVKKAEEAKLSFRKYVVDKQRSGEVSARGTVGKHVVDQQRSEGVATKGVVERYVKDQVSEAATRGTVGKYMLEMQESGGVSTKDAVEKYFIDQQRSKGFARRVKVDSQDPVVRAKTAATANTEHFKGQSMKDDCVRGTREFMPRRTRTLSCQRNVPLTFDEELKAVVSGFRNNRNQLLRSTSHTELNQTRSLHRGAKISVKPLWSKEEDFKPVPWHFSTLPGKRFHSVEHLPKEKLGKVIKINRTQRTQSLVIRNDSGLDQKPGAKLTVLKTTPGPVKDEQALFGKLDTVESSRALFGKRDTVESSRAGVLRDGQNQMAEDQSSAYRKWYHLTSGRAMNSFAAHEREEKDISDETHNSLNDPREMRIAPQQTWSLPRNMVIKIRDNIDAA